MIDIYVINLKHRTDRKEQMIKKFKQFENINIKFIEAIKHENGAIGCLKSHQKCIEIGKENNMEYIIVMEDDTIPCKYFEKRFNNILEYLNNNSFDIFLGMVNKTRKEHIIEKINYPKETLLKISMGHCANLIIYNKKAYEFFLSIDENNFIAIDHEWHNKLSAIVTLPFIVSTETDYSDIEKKNVNYINKINLTQTHLMNEFL